MTLAATLERRSQMGLTMLDIQDERAAYDMPAVVEAMMVMYYPGGRREHNGFLAWVVRMHEGSQNIGQLYVPLGSPKVATSVPHVTDPVLKLGGAHVENGAWDYTDDYMGTVGLRKELDVLKADVAELKAGMQTRVEPQNVVEEKFGLEEGTLKVKRPRTEGQLEYEKLYQAATKNGFKSDTPGRPKKQEIVEFLEEREIIVV